MKNLILAVLSLVTGSVVSAMPVVGNNGLESKLVEVTASSPQKCANFSGTWSGTCVTGKQSEKVSFTIGQKGCEYITIANAFFAIGGTRGESHAIPNKGGDLFTQTITHTNWTHDNKVLVFSSDVAISQTGKGYIYSDHIDGAAYFDGAKLIMADKGKHGSSSCLLTR